MTETRLENHQVVSQAKWLEASTRHDVRGTSGDDAQWATLVSRFVIRVRTS